MLIEDIKEELMSITGISRCLPLDTSDVVVREQCQGVTVKI